MNFDVNLKLLSGKNTEKVNNQNIWDSLDWVFDELNEIIDEDFFEYERIMVYS